MPHSYRAINYSLRPAKAVERKMMGEAFRRLHPFQRVEEYRYVGFGSIYFSDFQLIHQTLGVNDMVSIERDASAELCFRFNRPYRTIDLKFGPSTDVLPQLDWQRRSIVWLDYDGKLDHTVLADIDTFCARCVSGSAFIISVNAQPEAELNEDERKTIEAQIGEPFDAAKHRLRKLTELVGDKVPPGILGGELRGKGIASVFRRIIHNQILSQLTVRNALLPEAERTQYRQIFHFHYKDGAQMLTVGGVFFKLSESNLYEACAFEKLPFVRIGENAYNIRVPCLTAKEVRHLNAQLPCLDATLLEASGVPSADLVTYAEVYRYFPAFNEILFA